LQARPEGQKKEREKILTLSLQERTVLKDTEESEGGKASSGDDQLKSMNAQAGERVLPGLNWEKRKTKPKEKGAQEREGVQAIASGPRCRRKKKDLPRSA